MKLNIQLFAKGTIDNFNPVKGTSSATLLGKIEWSSVGDAAKNESVITTKLYAKRTDNFTSTPTSGKSWKGTVKVGSNTEHEFKGFSKETSVASNWVLFATYTDTVKHNTDGTCTVTISGSVTGPTGTSLAGKTSKGSKTVELDTLHKIPDNVQYTMIETNQKLIDASIANDVFVKNLSIKTFNINGDVYDGATIKEYGIINRIMPYGTATLPLVIDFSQNEILTDLTYVTKVPITGRIIDSYDTAGYSETLLFEYVPYNKINLIETSTTVKRNGQTSGKVRLSINGNLYNGIVGNIDQSTYKPIVKYKFWQTGTEEPISYDYEIPSDNITIENGVFSVSNYEIGSSVETDINWFNPDNAYKIKVYVKDNFTYYESQEKSIAVGEATWTEYKNRVDFKKLTINGIEVKSTKTIFEGILLGGESINLDTTQRFIDVYFAVSLTNHRIFGKYTLDTSLLEPNFGSVVLMASDGSTGLDYYVSESKFESSTNTLTHTRTGYFNITKHTYTDRTVGTGASNYYIYRIDTYN